MQILQDYQGTKIRLTDERLTHILEHPEMANMEQAITDALRSPEIVVQSVSDAASRLYYRYYSTTLVGGKHLCVVVKIGESDAFVLTAYLTDKVKKGEILWTAKS